MPPALSSAGFSEKGHGNKREARDFEYQKPKENARVAGV
jgi:hypothetical protein